MDECAARATRELGLGISEFLPFEAAWPQVRDGYLPWLAKQETLGFAFAEAEVAREQPLGSLKLVGRIDRIDTRADGAVMVIDYKTEARGTTAERVKEPFEDTQLAFYAALLADDTLEAAYVNVGEKDGTRSYPQPEVVAARDALVHGIIDDMRRIGQGARLPALGEGAACDYCAARGLCRKDFWGPA
jgi:ATP-dependent helicase/nuclease subunit B